MQTKDNFMKPKVNNADDAVRLTEKAASKLTLVRVWENG